MQWVWIIFSSLANSSTSLVVPVDVNIGNRTISCFAYSFMQSSCLALHRFPLAFFFQISVYLHFHCFSNEARTRIPSSSSNTSDCICSFSRCCWSSLPGIGRSMPKTYCYIIDFFHNVSIQKHLKENLFHASFFQVGDVFPEDISRTDITWIISSSISIHSRLAKWVHLSEKATRVHICICVLIWRALKWLTSCSFGNFMVFLVCVVFLCWCFDLCSLSAWWILWVFYVPITSLLVNFSASVGCGIRKSGKELGVGVKGWR